MFAVGERVAIVVDGEKWSGKVTDTSSAPVEYEVAFDRRPGCDVVLGSRLQKDEQ